MSTRHEEYLTTTLASIGDAVISTDADGRILFANRAALELLKAAEPDVLGKHLDQVFHIQNEFTRAEIQSPVAMLMREGTAVALEKHAVLIAHDGSEIPIDDSAAPIRDESGKILGAVLVFRDVTERRRAETASRLLAAIVESSDDAIIGKDTTGVITSWNQGAERIFGYSAAEAIGKSISILAPDVDEMPKILERILNGERIDHYETVRKTKSGKLVNISLTVSPVHDAEGRVIGASKIARDITERVRSQAELAEQRERLRVTLSSIGDAVIATDGRGIVTYLNPVAEELTGWQASEAAGKPLEEVFRILNEETRRGVESPVKKVLQHGQVVGLANHTLLIARDGRERSVDDSAAPIRTAQGQVAGVVLIFRDVTERRLAERQLRAQASELYRTNEELSQFAYAASHDLREPLRNIVNFSELLVRKGSDRLDPESQLFATYIAEGVRRLEKLLNDLLNYSQMGGPQEQPARPIDTNEVVETAVANLRSAIGESGAQITRDDLPIAFGHEAQVLQLFQNLISNAIKYRSDQPPQVHIRAQASVHGSIFSVKDNGIGIAPEYHKLVFGVFKRLHGREIEGTGIGLAICSKVVERHGGRIWVESRPGEGSEFFFTLPTPPASGKSPLDPV